MNYLILTPKLVNLGGAQLYTLRRCRNLVKEGHNVIILVYSNKGDFILETPFSQLGIKIINIPLLKYPFSLSYIICNILICTKIRPYLRPNLEVIIESHTRNLSAWGEFIANKYNGINFIYMLDEFNPSLFEKYQYYPYVDFFRFKFSANQFIGLSQDFISFSFNERMKSDYVNIGIDLDEIADITIPSIDHLKEELKNKFVIGTLTRLEKEYLIPMINSIIDFTNDNPDKDIVLLVAGGSHQKSLLNILKNKFSYCNSNIRIIFMGYLSPVGKDFYELLDVYVGQGTSAIYAISCQVPAILMSRDGSYTYGFLGYNVKSFAYIYDPERYSLQVLLNKYLMSSNFREELVKLSHTFFLEEYMASECFNKFNNLIDSLLQKKSIDKYKLKFKLNTFFSDIGTFFFKRIRKIKS